MPFSGLASSFKTVLAFYYFQIWKFDFSIDYFALFYGNYFIPTLVKQIYYASLWLFFDTWGDCCLAWEFFITKLFSPYSHYFFFIMLLMLLWQGQYLCNFVGPICSSKFVSFLHLEGSFWAARKGLKMLILPILHFHFNGF